MVAFLETGLAETWVIATLKADSVIAAAGVFGYVVPQGAAFPCLVISLVTGTDASAANGTRGATECIYLVKAVDKGSDSSGADGLMARGDGLLHRQRGTVTGLRVLECVRESVIKYPEKYEGVTYWHVGAQYRVWCQQA